MKKAMTLILALLMVLSMASLAEDLNLSELSDEALNALGAALEAERKTRSSGEWEPLMKGSGGDNVKTLQQKLIDLGYLDDTADGRFGARTEKALKEMQKVLGWEQSGRLETAEQLEAILAAMPGDGVNLAAGTSDRWSEWYTPQTDAENVCFTVGCAYPGDKKPGELFTCQAEVEFRGVKPIDGKNFSFHAQGAVDGAWDIKNIWNWQLIDLKEAPKDGVNHLISTQKIEAGNAGAAQFDLRFRCDNWGGGAFRVRRVKVERGFAATKWSLSPRDAGDGINLVENASDKWSDWMTPEPNAENVLFNVGSVHLKDTALGDAYSCQVDIEFRDVKQTFGEPFSFHAQGSVNGEWKLRNIWNERLINLTEPPRGGVFHYTSTYRINPNNIEGEQFDLNFRCDYWSRGSFRVRRVKVERGAEATSWTAYEGLRTETGLEE